MIGTPYEADLSFVFNYPTKVSFGADLVADVGLEVGELGCSHALVVTDAFLREKTAVVARVERALAARCAGVFDGVVADSGVDVCEAGAALGREVGADCVVSVGGGSSIDTAKGIAILLREGGRLADYEGFQNLTRPQTPHVAIPTTAGTGSEVTYVAVIKDRERKQKLLFASHHITPNVALLDPTVTLGMPPHITAGTGMDAMSHAIEALHSQQRQPICDGLALHAIRLIRTWLERATHHGDDLGARGQMLIASNMAGAAFGNAQVGLVHAMAHTLGAHYGVHHGTANALLLPHVMLFNREVCAETYRAVADALGLDARGMSADGAAEAAATFLYDLAGRLGLPQRLRDTNVPESALEALAEGTLYDGAIVYNPRTVLDAEEVLEVFRHAW
jgi:alcohol dehydrogenase class IV